MKIPLIIKIFNNFTTNKKKSEAILNKIILTNNYKKTINSHLMQIHYNKKNNLKY